MAGPTDTLANQAPTIARPRTPQTSASAAQGPQNNTARVNETRLELAATNHLASIQPTQAPPIKAKSCLQWLRECISLGLIWSKIGLNQILPFKIFSLQENQYCNPFKHAWPSQTTAQGISLTLNATLDYLKTIKNCEPKAHIIDAQAKMIFQICHGEASDFILDCMNYCVQESYNGVMQTSILDQLPKSQRQQLQQLLLSLQSSGIFSGAKAFSRHLTREQQKQTIEKLTEFPFRQLAILPRQIKKGLALLEKYPSANLLAIQLIQGQGEKQRQKLAEKASYLSTAELAPYLKEMVENGAEILDAYKRASYQPDPLQAREIRKEAIQKLLQNIRSDQAFLPAFHAVIDAIDSAHQSIDSGTANPLANSKLLDIAKIFCRQIPEHTLISSLTSLCDQYAAPIHIFKSMTDRLNLQQERTALASLLDSRSEISQSCMNLFLNAVKKLATGQPIETGYNAPAPLSEALDLKGGCELVHDIFTHSQSSATSQNESVAELKQVLNNPKHLPFLRNLLSQNDFQTSIAQFSDKLPATFRESLSTVIANYHLDTISKLGKHIIPHINDTELSQIINRLPMPILEMASQKIDNLVQYLGDPDNNLTTALARQTSQHKRELDEVWTQCLTQYPELMIKDQDPRKDKAKLTALLQAAQVYTNREGVIAEHRLITIMAQRDKFINQLRTQLNPSRSNSNSSKTFDELNKLLADMGIKQDLSQITPINVFENNENPTRHNLTTLRSTIAQHRISEELYHTIQLLLPAANDEPGRQDTDGFDIKIRKQLLAASFKAVADGASALSELQPPAMPALKETIAQDNIDMLWRFTKDLVGATERKITVPVANSQIIFMEDGSCVDELGELLPKGHTKNEQLRSEYNIEQQMLELRPAVRSNLRDMLQNFWPDLVIILAENPKDQDFINLLKSAHLPEDVRALMVNLLNQLLPKNLRESAIGQYATYGLQGLAPELMQKVVDALPDELLDRFAGQVTRLINDLNPYEQMPFFKTFADQLVGSLGENQSIQSVADVLTKGYYTEVCHADKRTLANAILALGCPEFDSEGNISPKSMKAFVDAMTQAGGPGFQKAMQLFKSDIHIPSIREALTSMDSEVTPMADDEVQEVIHHSLKTITNQNNQPKFMLVNPDEYQIPPDQIWLNKQQHWPQTQEIKDSQLQLLGSATIAQTHKAYLWHCENGVPQTHRPPEVVAMKVQRDKIAHRIYREMHALQRISNISDSVQQTLKELERSIVGETDFSREFQFGKLMQELYAKPGPNGQTSNDVKVIDMLAHSDRLLIQRFSPGKTISKLWQQKSAEFNIYFGDLNAYVDKKLKKNPNRIHVLSNTTPDDSRIISRLKITTRNKETIHELASDDPLVELLQVAQNKGQIPGAIDTQQLTSAIFKRFDNPLTDTVNLTQQAKFLDVTGQRLAGLVGRFASAAFIGVEAKNAYHLSSSDPQNLNASERARKIFIEEIKIENKDYYSIQQFDTAGDLHKAVQIPIDLGVKEAVLPDDAPLPSALARQLSQALPRSANTTYDKAAAQKFFDNLSRKESAHLNNLIREVLGESVLFEGESFIDSDRHDGNLLFKERGVDYEYSELTCIDTGAGTIVTRYERDGMLQLAVGLTTTDSKLLMEGLQKLIPDFDALLDKDDASFRLKHDGQSKRQIVEQDLAKSIRGEFVEIEKCQEIFQFLLINDLVHEQLTSNFFQDLLNNRHADLNTRLFDFQNPAASVDAIIEYVNRRHSAKGLPTVALTGETQDEFKTYLQNLDYGRVFRTTGPDSSKILNITTDKHNSLLFIKSIRKIANVLDQHNIYAPESIIQLNRGTKFIEDQIKTINANKQELRQKFEALGALPPSIAAKLEPVNLGAAYVWGIPTWSITKDVLGALTPQENLRALSLGSKNMAVQATQYVWSLANQLYRMTMS